MWTLRGAALFYFSLLAAALVLAAGRWLGYAPVLLTEFACMGLLSLVGVWSARLPDWLDDRPGQGGHQP